jgi:SNF2 family DNA or RNA helicase
MWLIGKHNSTSNNNDDNDNPSSDSSSSSGSSDKPKPRPQPLQIQPVASTSTALFSSTHDGMTRDSNSLSPGPEANQNQPVYYYDPDMNDPDFQRRDFARKVGYLKPYLPWEKMSHEYLLWFRSMQVHSPAPVTETLATVEPSPNITLPLLKFQKEWLAWGLKQEASEVRGGILADEMGMGKTIQAISLVVTARDLRVQSEASCSSSRGNNKCTLVVCPVVALNQWAKEIEKHTVNGSVRVLVFHGAKRPRGEVDFSQYDFVLTTYSMVLNSDYEYYYLIPHDEVRNNCSRKFTDIDTLNDHIRYHLKLFRLCHCLSSAFYHILLFLWLYWYSGINRDSCIEKDRKKKKKWGTKTHTDPSDQGGLSLLHSVRWERIILDEVQFTLLIYLF